ncbi:MAG: CDP-alcohol phosphatidyltransferase family protein [Sphingomonadaceae bacterium]
MIQPTRRGVPLRTVAPNAITALALCFGLTGIRFAIAASGAEGSANDWVKAIGCIVIAGILDGVDGRVARMFRGESRFGAELDSLSDVIAFGVSPALIVYLWSLQQVPRLGWFCALGFVVCQALRLARFNARIDADDQPHKSAGFLTGVPAPAGAGLAFLPLYLWIVTDEALFRSPYVVAPWMAFVAALMISNVATYSWGSIRLRRTIRLEAILLVALIGTALFAEPLWTLIGVSIAYVLLIPFSMRSYAQVKRRRGAAASPPGGREP